MTATATKSAIESHGTNGGQRERDDVARERDLALAVAADRLLELRARLVDREQRQRQQRERDRAPEQHDRVGRDGPGLRRPARRARPSPAA